MAFAQLAYRESLRDIEVCLLAQASKLYHMGFREPIRRSTLADANELRNWRIHAEFASRLIAQARALYASENFGLELSNTVYVLDSTTASRCFPGRTFARPRRRSRGKLHDVHALDLLTPEAGAIYVMDRAYVDFARLHGLHLAGAFFITCAKSNLKAHRVYSAQTDRSTGILCDQRIALDGFYSKQDYPTHLRRVRFKYPQTSKTFIFLTNQMNLSAATICALYKNRWQVGLFFKWIKQFFGTSENAVKTQIWIAVAVYVLVTIVRKKLNLDVSLYTLLQVLSLTLFEKMPLQQAFPANNYTCSSSNISNQLNLFSI